MVPKSTYDIKMLFNGIHMVWMDRWSHHNAFTTAFDDQDLRIQLKSWYDSSHLTIPSTCDSGCRHSWHGSHIISNITMVSDIIHMMWMGRKIHHHAATTAAVGTDWGS
jgi:hypothetical protein